MYNPPKYRKNESQFIHDFIQEYPFATMVLQGSQLLATHVPVLIEGPAQKFRLYAHISNNNPMWEYLRDDKEMLLIFKGPDAYISSSWYAAPDIPTWDYSAVHVNARIRLQSQGELQRSLEKLIAHFEKEQENPLDIDKIPQDVWTENFKEITGFWLEPTEMVGIAKLHQGFPKSDILNITEQLNKHPSCPMNEIGALIKKQYGV